MRNQFVWRVLTLAPLLFGTASCADVPPHPSGHELRAEKHGRIVDADTGAGIPDAKIVAVWTQHSSGVSDMVSADSWCNLQKIVVTDSDGRFVIPDVSHELDARETHFGPLSLNKLWSDWRLIVFKPGYIRVGKDYPIVKPEQGNPGNQQFTLDDRKVLDHRINGGDRACLPNQGCMPNFVWQAGPPETHGALVGRVDVQTIEMKKVELSPPETWTYYGAILSSSGCSDSPGKPLDAPEFNDVSNRVRDIVRPIPCSMPQETPIGVRMLNAYMSLVHNPRFDHRIVQAVGQYQWGTMGTTAGTLCHALIDEENAP